MYRTNGCGNRLSRKLLLFGIITTREWSVGDVNPTSIRWKMSSAGFKPCPGVSHRTGDVLIIFGMSSAWCIFAVSWGAGLGTD